jgi:homoserine/homoserine lactone efflux protein
MSLHTWIAFALLNAAISFMPGPNLLLSLSHGLRHGPRRTLATALGLLAGLWVLMGITAAGLGAVFAASGWAFLAVKWAGALYLAWLGFRAWRAPTPRLSPSGPTEDGASPLRLAAQGFGVALGNPKAIAFLGALFPQFIDPARPWPLQMAILATTTSVIEFTMIMLTASGAGRLAPWLRQGNRARWINRASGGALLGAAAVLAWLKAI